MINKSAIFNAAQKFAAKGQLDKAIAEWEKLLNEKTDGNTYNTLGDLYLKRGSEKEALDSFKQAAEIFKKEGFFPKAIAIYKKILNIVPNDVDTLIELAKLDGKKGLVGNAIENYFKAAEIFQRSGATEKTLAVIEKVIQLSPSDLNTRSKIAELYLRCGHRERAANEYSEIASGLLEKNNYEKAREYYMNAIDYDSENIQAITGLSRLAEKTGDIDNALKYIAQAMSHDPSNKEILLVYSDLCIKNGKTDDARNTIEKLIGSDPSNIQAKKILGTIHINEGQIEKAWELLQPCVEELSNEKKWEDALELLNGFREAYPIPASEHFANIYRAKGDSEALINELTNLANLYESAGLSEDALNLYKEILESAPDDTITANKVRELELALGITPPAEEHAEGPESGEGMMEGLMTTTHESPDTAMTPDTDNGLMENNMVSTHEVHEDEPRTEETVPQKNEALSPEEFAARKSEADFFVQQGMKDEAIAIYEELLSISPDNDEVRQSLASLRATGAEQKEEIQDEPAPGKTEETGNYEARYAAGLEYKEKGLFDEAIREFQAAAKAPQKKMMSLRMIALCHIEKGAYSYAVAEYNKIIDSLSPDDGIFLRMKYELAEAYMKNRDSKKALELYTEIHAQDPEFKDISKKIEEVTSLTQEPEDSSKPKKNRVSYI